MSRSSIWTDHNQIYSLHFKVYGATGHWRIKSTSRWKQIIYDLYFGIIHLAFVTETIASVIDAFIIRNNLEKISTNLCSTITLVGTVYKIWVFIINKDKIAKISHKLQNNLYLPQVPKEAVKDISEKYAKLVAKVSKTLWVSGSFLFVFWSIFPILDPGREKRYPFPFPVYNALSPIYEIIYVYHVLVLLSIAFNVLTYDMIFYGFMARICAQYEIVTRNIEGIKDLSWREEEGLFPDDEQLRDEKIVKIIKENVIHHRAILSHMKEIENLFSGPMFAQITCGASLIAVIAYGLITKSEVAEAAFSLEQMQRIFYVECALFDIWLYCYFGTQLEIRSNQLRYALYDNPWYEMKVETRKLYMIMISALQRKVKIRGGGIFQVTLKTYLGLLKISYNLTAILRQTRSRS